MGGQPANVRELGACGNGLDDDFEVFQKALDKAGDILIPPGLYKIGGTLKIGSNTRLKAMPGAVMVLADDACKAVGDFFLTNKNPGGGDTNITVEGGVWNGNNKGNPRRGGLFAQDCYTGVMFNFINVRGLSLTGMKLCDAESYFIRLGEVDGFTVCDIDFEAFHMRPNQDGVHLGGFCFHGEIENIRATMAGSTNDDVIALNADDEVNRLVNLGMKRGPIEHIMVKNVSAADCHTFVRLLSVHATISDIVIDGVTGGFRTYALNMDAARYCRTPLFKDADEPLGVGDVRDVVIKNMSVHKTTDNDNSLVFIETNAESIRIEDFKRRKDLEPPNTAKSFEMGKMKPVQLLVDGDSVETPLFERVTLDGDGYKSIVVKGTGV